MPGAAKAETVALLAAQALRRLHSGSVQDTGGRPNYDVLYDTLVGDTYDQDVFGILEAAHQLALDQVLKHLPASGVNSVCDVAAGTGHFLEVLSQWLPQATLYG